MIAALYVEKDGAYFGLPDVDPWDETRDARLYAGPWPVVAHPPCNTWCQLAPLNEHRYGHPVGDDGGCFAAALAAVRRFGGVLEHPAYSYAWAAFNLPNPIGRGGWTATLTDPGVTAEVDQAAYGHRARKRTWLYYIGPQPPALRWDYTSGDGAVVSLMSYVRGEGVADYLGNGRSSATPEPFREALLSMARSPSFTEQQ